MAEPRPNLGTKVLASGSLRLVERLARTRRAIRVLDTFNRKIWPFGIDDLLFWAFARVETMFWDCVCYAVPFWDAWI